MQEKETTSEKLKWHQGRKGNLILVVKSNNLSYRQRAGVFVICGYLFSGNIT